jgi:hypothetical protein
MDMKVVSIRHLPYPIRDPSFAQLHQRRLDSRMQTENQRHPPYEDQVSCTLQSPLTYLVPAYIAMTIDPKTEDAMPAEELKKLQLNGDGDKKEPVEEDEDDEDEEDENPQAGNGG